MSPHAGRRAITIRIFLVDDHELIRRAIVGMFRDTEVSVVGEFETGEWVVAAARKLVPDVILLDVRMPVVDGFETLRLLRRDGSHAGVLMLSTFTHPEYIAQAVGLGAHGYLAKSVSRETLLDAIRQAAGGKHVWSPGDLRRTAKPAAGLPLTGQVPPPLSSRKQAVLAQIVLGQSNTSIAQKLGMGYEQVKGDVESVLRKFEVDDRTQAAIAAVRSTQT